MLQINSRLSIPLEEFRLSYARSAGPGGQHVNKVSSKVILHWNVLESPSLPDDVRRRFIALHRARLNRDGELVLQSQRYRQQRRNVDDCYEKLRQMVLEASVPPKPRKPTRPTAGSRERRLKEKHRHSQKKQERRPPRRDD